MKHNRLPRPATLALVLLGLSSTLPLAGCGCGAEESRYGSPDQLRQTRLRFTPDGDGELCYIVAEVQNPGELPVKAAMVTATLRNSRGKELGINRHRLGSLEPGQERVFSMRVTAHGEFSHVDLVFHEPDGN